MNPQVTDPSMCPGHVADTSGHGVPGDVSASVPPHRGDTRHGHPDTPNPKPTPEKINKTFSGTQEAACLEPDCQAGPWTARNALAVAARHTKVFGHPTVAYLDTKVTITREAGAA